MKALRRLSGIVILFALTLNGQAQERPRIGVVLSGGGARGLAHVGVLKMLDSLAIPVDYIAGTSMGSICASLYAVGYSGNEIESLVRGMDWPALFSDKPPRRQLPYAEKKRAARYLVQVGFDGWRPMAPTGLIRGQNIRLEFSRLMAPYDRNSHFDDFFIPFRCVAAELNRCDVAVLSQGNLARAVRASMSIPTAFTPVIWGDSLFIDGGMVNNYPADAVHAMGAQKIIGCDVMGPQPEEQPIRNIVDVLSRTLGFLGVSQWRENLDLTDIYIAPDLKGYSIMDFVPERVDGIMARGDSAAQRVKADLVALKEQYGLACYSSPEPGKAFILDSLSIHGLCGMTEETLRLRLGLTVGRRFTLTGLDQRVRTVQVGSPVDTIGWQVIPVDDQRARVRIRVRESCAPIIEGLEIHGQETIPFGTIYRHLDIRPGEQLDVDKLCRHIMDLYGLGYFEEIDYDLVPVKPGYVRLHLNVRERPRRQLSFGFHYDSYYKLVLGMGATASNILLPGLRAEHDLKVAGLTQMNAQIYYPSRTLNLPVYPLIRLQYRDIPTRVYDLNSRSMAEYRDRGTNLGFGLGLLMGRDFNLNACYQVEWLDTEPDVAMPDSEMFPAWTDRLHQMVVRVDLDRLDDALAPRNGLLLQGLFEGSYRELGSDLGFRRASLEVDLYKTLGRHTVRAHAFFGRSSKGAPTYKNFNRGRPDFFVGVQADQLFAANLDVYRLDYQFWISPFASIKAMANVARNLTLRFPEGELTIPEVRGFGIALQAVTPLGVAELTLSKGDRNWVGTKAWQKVANFSIGVPL